LSRAPARSARSAASGLSLAPVLDMPAARRLAAVLGECRGRPIEVDASRVKRIGALALQVLLSARKTWAADGHLLRLRDPSPQLCEALALSGAQELGGAERE
jgi:chemotaxis protein CheX